MRRLRHRRGPDRATNSAAAAEDVCGALARLATAAREPTPLRHWSRPSAQATVVPGFAAQDCEVARGALACGAHDFAASHFAGWSDPLPCPGFIDVHQLPYRSRRERVWLYRSADLQISFGLSCLGCAGGTHSFFHAEAVARADLPAGRR